MPSRMQLALDAIRVEQERLKENVGSQDQVMAAFGGFNRLDFSRNGHIQVSPVLLARERLLALQDRLLLVYTGISRTASEIAGEQIKATLRKRQELTAIYQMVDEAMGILQGQGSLDELGKLLHEGWRIKRSLTDKVSTSQIDEIYDAARRAGAIGGKILGAGGGGFLLLLVRPEDKAKVRSALDSLLQVPVEFEHSGSRIIFYDPDGARKETRHDLHVVGHDLERD